MVRKSEIDDKDLKILEILKENSRTPYVAIAKKLGLSEGAIRKRVKRLEELGIIKKYTIEVDYKVLGLKRVWIGIDVYPERLIHVLNEIVSFKNKSIKGIYTSSGDHNIMIEFVYRDRNELNNFIMQLENLDGVIKVCPAILVEKVL